MIDAAKDGVAFAKNAEFESFCKDNKLQSAAIMKNVVAGEASKYVIPDVKNKFPFIAWKKIAGVREEES